MSLDTDELYLLSKINYINTWKLIIVESETIFINFTKVFDIVYKKRIAFSGICHHGDFTWIPVIAVYLYCC